LSFEPIAALRQKRNRKRILKLSLQYSAVVYLAIMGSKGKFSGFFVQFKGEDVWLGIFCIEAVWIIAINIITIITFSTNRRIFSRAIYMIINLSVSDMLYGCSVLVFFGYSLLDLNNSQEKQVKSIFVALMLFTVIASGTSVALVAIDRFFATFFPFRYYTANYQYGTAVLGINWFLCLSLAIIHYLTPSKKAKILLGFYASLIVFSLAVIVVSYTTILIKVRSKGQTINRLSTSAVQIRDRKLAYTSMLVTFSSLLAWLPIGVVFLLYLRTSIHVPIEISGCAVIVQTSNSFLNPVIYTFRMTHFKEALFKLFCKCERYRIRPVNLVRMETSRHTIIITRQHAITNC